MIRKAMLGFLLVGGCGEGPAVPPAGDAIACRVGGAAEFAPVCTAEAVDGESGRTIVVRKPDGGFRRLLVAEDGRGVVAADGAEQAQVTIVDAETIEVEIGGDTFRLPATVQAP